MSGETSQHTDPEVASLITTNYVARVVGPKGEIAVLFLARRSCGAERAADVLREEARAFKDSLGYGASVPFDLEMYL